MEINREGNSGSSRIGLRITCSEKVLIRFLQVILGLGLAFLQSHHLAEVGFVQPDMGTQQLSE